MLSKRTFSPVKSTSAVEDGIDSPFGKQGAIFSSIHLILMSFLAKLNNVDGPGKNYFEFINSTMKEERESDEESELPNKEEDLSEAFNKARNYLMNFLQLTQKIKERNFLSQKELKTKFKVNFAAFPNTDEILKIFNKILKRHILFLFILNFFGLIPLKSLKLTQIDIGENTEKKLVPRGHCIIALGS